MNLFDRVFQLHRIMAGRRSAVPFSHIQSELECSRATARRVIEHLRDMLGAPLVFDREAGGYRYEGESLYELPGLWFSANELSALLTLDALTAQEPSGLVSNTLAPFRARLEKLLAREGLGLPGWRERLRLLDAHARKPGPHFSAVAGALAQRQQLSLSYQARGGGDSRSGPAASQRRVSPQRLTRYRGNWYLDAYCHEREALRSFAVEQILAAEALPDAAIDLPSDQLDATLASSYGIFSGTPTAVATLKFSAYAARWVADEVWHPDQRDQQASDGSLLREIPYHASSELAAEILRHGANVEVLKPERLRAEVCAHLQAALAQYPASIRKPASST